MMTNFGWNYPPGITGNEYEIASPDYKKDIEDACPKCNYFSMVKRGYKNQRWHVCYACGFTEDLPERCKYDNPNIP